MAKKAKATKKPAAKQPANKSAGNGVSALAKEMGLEPASVRVKLRAAKVKRKGRDYVFTPAEVKKLAKELAAGA